jgi:hypothetical protein
MSTAKTEQKRKQEAKIRDNDGTTKMANILGSNCFPYIMYIKVRVFGLANHFLVHLFSLRNGSSSSPTSIKLVVKWGMGSSRQNQEIAIP